jgi:hypothetical protein
VLPPHARVLGREPRGEADAVGGLRDGREDALLQRVEGLHQQAGAGVGEPPEQVAGGVQRPDGLGEGAEHGTGVEPGLQQERRRPGDLVPGDDRVLHGRGPAPRGQDGEVQVDPAQPRQTEDRRWHEVAVGHDGRGVRGDLRDPRLHLGVLQRGRREHLDPGLEGALLDRARRERAAPPRAGVGSGQDGDDLVAGGEQGVQGGQRHRGRPGEEQAHGHRS